MTTLEAAPGLRCVFFFALLSAAPRLVGAAAAGAYCGQASGPTGGPTVSNASIPQISALGKRFGGRNRPAARPRRPRPQCARRPGLRHERVLRAVRRRPCRRERGAAELQRLRRRPFSRAVRALARDASGPTPGRAGARAPAPRSRGARARSRRPAGAAQPKRRAIRKPRAVLALSRPPPAPRCRLARCTERWLQRSRRLAPKTTVQLSQVRRGRARLPLCRGR